MAPDPAQRDRLAAHWTRAALAEHASVASFARFTLHLMAIGAPPQLLLESHRAGIDEIEHAKLCFRLAGRFSGAPVGPGPLPMAGDVLGPTDLISVTLAAVREACVGETLSALEAAEARDLATDPEVREVLGAIAEDEARHAELGWQFVQWALAAGGADLHAAVRATLDLELNVVEAEPADDEPDDTAFGRLSRHARWALRRRGRAELLQPVAAALLGATPSRPG